MSPDGTVRDVTLRLGLPRRVDEVWHVGVVFDGLDLDPADLAGIDAWQALVLAQRFAATRLAHLAAKGWTFRWAPGGEPARPEDLADGV